MFHKQSKPSSEINKSVDIVRWFCTHVHVAIPINMEMGKIKVFANSCFKTPVCTPGPKIYVFSE